MIGRSLLGASLCPAQRNSPTQGSPRLPFPFTFTLMAARAGVGPGSQELCLQPSVPWPQVLSLCVRRGVATLGTGRQDLWTRGKNGHQKARDQSWAQGQWLRGRNKAMGSGQRSVCTGLRTLGDHKSRTRLLWLPVSLQVLNPGSGPFVTSSFVLSPCVHHS